jgi:MFS transporter, DHA3 family, macrolide efflux protein
LIAIATLVLIYLFSTGRQSVLAIFVILLIRSTGGAFHYPAMQASTSLMVPKEQLARIAGLNQTLNGVITVFAPPLGALLIGFFPLYSVLFVDVFTAIIAVSLLAIVAIPQPIKKNENGGETLKPNSYLQDLKEGWQYMIKWPGLLSLALLAMFLNFLLTPSSSLIPLMVTNVYKGGAVQLGLVESLVGVGVILGGLILSVWGGFKKKILTSIMGIIGMGIGIIIFGILPGDQFYLALGACFFLGLMQVFANGPLSAIFQATIDPAMQGRVLSLIVAGATAMSPISLLVAGPVADNLGLRTWYIAGGIVSVLAALSAYFIPAIMGMEDNHPNMVLNEKTIPVDQ